MKIKIVRQTMISGTPALVGEVLEVDETTASTLISGHKAEPCSAGDDAGLNPAAADQPGAPAGKRGGKKKK